MNQVNSASVKINWGRGLTIGMVLFMTFITTLVIVLMSKKVDLVSEDYYRSEIAYGDEITAKENWNALGIELKFEQLPEHILLRLPEIDGVQEFQLFLNRPNNQLQDMNFSILQSNTFLIKRTALESGWYNYRLNAVSNGKSYLSTGKYYVK